MIKFKVPVHSFLCLKVEGKKAFTFNFLDTNDKYNTKTSNYSPESWLHVLLCDVPVVRGSIMSVSHDSGRQTSLVEVSAKRVYWQHSRVFEQHSAGPSWHGRVHTLLQCHVKPGGGEFLFTGSEHFGEAWLGCAPRYKDFLSVYRTAWAARQNSCDFPLDWGSALFSNSSELALWDPCNTVCQQGGSQHRQQRWSLLEKQARLEEQKRANSRVSCTKANRGLAFVCNPTVLRSWETKEGVSLLLCLCASPSVNPCWSLCWLCVTLALSELGWEGRALCVPVNRLVCEWL